MAGGLIAQNPTFGNPSPTDSLGAPTLSDDFSGFSDGASISGGVFNWGQLNPGTIKASTDFLYPGTTRSCKFAFGPVPPTDTLELDFNLGSSHSEVWMKWYVRYPSNFVHIDSASSDNDKFFRIWHTTDGYDSFNKVGCSTELAGRGNTQYEDLASEWVTFPDDGGGFTARSIVSGTSQGFAVAKSDFITPSDFTNWVEIVIRVKAATGSGGSNRAILQMWKDNVLQFSERPDNYNPAEVHSYDNGYIYGAANSHDTSTVNYNVYIAKVQAWLL